MGEIAEDYVEGECCCGCGQYFYISQTIPSLCEECYNELDKKERKHHHKSSSSVQ